MKILFLWVILLITYNTDAQEINRELKPFRAIVVSPKINVVLKKGEKESLHLEYEGIEEHKINVEVSSKTLHLFLDGARIVEKQHDDWNNHYQNSEYRNAHITAYITFTDLTYLEIRGNQKMICKDTISVREFTLKAYGMNEINLAYLNTGYLKTSLYGENILRIADGKSKYQKYRMFGENKVDTRGVRSAYATANTYGENQIKLNTKRTLRINALGDSRVWYMGNPDVDKRVVIGESKIAKID